MPEKGGWAHYGCALFCGDEWKSVGRDVGRQRGGFLFNHVPFFSGEVSLAGTGTQGKKKQGYAEGEELQEGAEKI